MIGRKALWALGIVLVFAATGVALGFVYLDGESTRPTASGSPTPSAERLLPGLTAPPAAPGASGPDAVPAALPGTVPTGGAAATAPDGVPALLEPGDLGAAHAVMTAYLTGAGTYDSGTDEAAWAGRLLPMTSGDASMRDRTRLPTGKAWDTCRARSCSARATAAVVRDAAVAEDLVAGSGKTVSTVVRVTSVFTESGASRTETTTWLVSAARPTATRTWVVSGVNLYGIGDAGTGTQPSAR